MAITNSNSGTNVHEVADGIYRINTPLALPGGQGFSFNQYLIVDDEPLLFHTGPRKMFPLVREAVASVLPVEQLRYIGFSHVEADECGSLNEWLAAAPQSVPLCGAVAAMVSIGDMADRAPRALADGELLALVSCKGGSGATFVAANLAHLLAAGGRRRVALIDMNLQFGDAALFLGNQTPPSHVADVARNIGRLDADLLQSAMTEAGPGLWVLAAPEDPAHAADVTPAQVQAILRQAREGFDFVVVDVGRSLSAATLAVLDEADRLFAVLQLTLPFIRDGKRLREVFRSLDYPADKVRWIVNRYQKDSQFSLDDLCRTLAVDAPITLPNHYEAVAAAVNQGVPVDTIAPASSIARALRELAAGVAPEAPVPQRRWLSGLFRGASA